jgi:hypothetical protein
LFVWLVLLVAATKMPLEEVMLVGGTKQNLCNIVFFRYLWVLLTAEFTSPSLFLLTLAWLSVKVNTEISMVQLQSKLLQQKKNKFIQFYYFHFIFLSKLLFFDQF